MPSACSASSVSAASAASTASVLSAISAELIAIESQPSFFSSPISAFQSSLILATPNRLPDLAIYIFLLLSIISVSLIIFSTIFYFPINTAKISSAITRTSRIFAELFKTNPIPYLVPACVPPVFAPFQFITCLVSLFILRTGPVRATYSRIPPY
jgi:glucan phosphoethanolaminetransferase (alkaline phosphatase superfamily)